MIDRLPEGKSIGWMQAPVQWIFAHTVRFLGIVRVVILDGEGFILIRKGQPLVYFFKHGRIELRGHGALDYFNTHKTIEFNLCKYTPEEFSRALEICEGEGIPQETAGVTAKGPSPPAHAEVVAKPVDELPVTRSVEQPRSVLPQKSEPEREKTGVVNMQEPKAVVTDRPLILQPGVLEEEEIKIIGQIKKLNGIIGISVFNDDRNILLMGDVEIEPLLKIARTMLTTIKTITPHLDWGFFVHMTLQIPEGNLIIAPYHKNHLCILTTRTINIGHIRRILRDLQQNGDRDIMR